MPINFDRDKTFGASNKDNTLLDKEKELKVDRILRDYVENLKTAHMFTWRRLAPLGTTGLLREEGVKYTDVKTKGNITNFKATLRPIGFGESSKYPFWVEYGTKGPIEAKHNDYMVFRDRGKISPKTGNFYNLGRHYKVKGQEAKHPFGNTNRVVGLEFNDVIQQQILKQRIKEAIES